MTNSRTERDDSGAVPVFVLHGPILHTEDIELGPMGEGGEDLRRWIQFINQECGGWAERPVSATDEAQEVLEKVLDHADHQRPTRDLRSEQFEREADCEMRLLAEAKSVAGPEPDRSAPTVTERLSVEVNPEGEA